MNGTRESSWKLVEKHGLSRNDQLPPLGVLRTTVSLPDIADRMLCMHALVATSYGLDPVESSRWLEEERLSATLVDFERKFLLGDISQQFAVQNQVYSIHALAWCCELLSDQCLLTPLPHDFVKLFPDLRRSEPSKNFRNQLKLRNSFGIIGFLDQLYCLNWALRDAQLSSAKTPLLRWLPAIEAQRHALDWLTTGNDWDSVPMDT